MKVLDHFNQTLTSTRKNKVFQHLKKNSFLGGEGLVGGKINMLSQQCISGDSTHKTSLWKIFCDDDFLPLTDVHKELKKQLRQ